MKEVKQKQMEIEVDEDYLKRVMAGEEPLYSEGKPLNVADETGRQQENDEPVHEEPAEPVKTGKRKNSRHTDFEGTFLKEAKIKDRRQMYISGEFYDRISSYLRIISDGKISMVGYVHNVLAHHMLEFRDMINEMYQNRINKSNPL